MGIPTDLFVAHTLSELLVFFKVWRGEPELSPPDECRDESYMGIIRTEAPCSQGVSYAQVYLVNRATCVTQPYVLRYSNRGIITLKKRGRFCPRVCRRGTGVFRYYRPLLVARYFRGVRPALSEREPAPPYPLSPMRTNAPVVLSADVGVETSNLQVSRKVVFHNKAVKGFAR